MSHATRYQVSRLWRVHAHVGEEYGEVYGEEYGEYDVNIGCSSRVVGHINVPAKSAEVTAKARAGSIKDDISG